MGYQTGLMRERVTILNRTAGSQGRFGKDSGGVEWEEGATIWAAVDFSRGVKSMREGALDAYDTIMVRTRWRGDLKRESRLKWQDKIWLIQSFHGDYLENIIQITAVELV